jgi:hypothetical protein
VSEGERAAPEVDAAKEGLQRLKVVFKLEVDDEGWPPAGSERMWASRVSDDTARLENVPFFARGYASGDVVRFDVDSDGVRWVREAVEFSGSCTIRIIPAQDGHLIEQRQAVLDAFAPLGVDGEGIGRFGMVALNVPSGADIAQVKRLVVEGAGLGRWHYEEGCVTEAWRLIHVS